MEEQWIKTVIQWAEHPGLIKPPLVGIIARDTSYANAGDILAGLYTTLGTVQIDNNVFISAADAERDLNEAYIHPTDVNFLRDYVARQIAIAEQQMEEFKQRQELSLEYSLEAFDQLVDAGKTKTPRDALREYKPQNINEKVAVWMYSRISNVEVVLAPPISAELIKQYLPDFVGRYKGE